MAIHTNVVCDIKADLYALIAADGNVVTLYGNTTRGDIRPVDYLYDASSSSEDNYPEVIKPTLQTGNGRWLKQLYQQYQSDWNQATNTEMDFIKNKPSIPAAQVNSDWNAVSGVAEILNKPTIPNIIRTTSTLSLSLVGTGATGTQISANKDSTVRLSCSTSTTSTIGGPATSVILLKINSTNDATEGTWTTVATLESDQTITLAVVLQSIQVVKGQLCADVPAGWYVKLVNSGTGTHSEAFLSGQQTIYG